MDSYKLNAYRYNLRLRDVLYVTVAIVLAFGVASFLFRYKKGEIDRGELERDAYSVYVFNDRGGDWRYRRIDDSLVRADVIAYCLRIKKLFPLDGATTPLGPAVSMQVVILFDNHLYRVTLDDSLGRGNKRALVYLSKLAIERESDRVVLHPMWETGDQRGGVWLSYLAREDYNALHRLLSKADGEPVDFDA